MNYKQASDIIEKSSWFREITGPAFAASRLIALERPLFERELKTIIDRHARQQVHLDEITTLCRHPIHLIA